MEKRLLFLLALAALAGVLLRRRRRPEGALSASDPAEELRRKLDESRELEAPGAPEPADDLDARRRSVHERARQAAEEMHPSGMD
jgi:hypothetical protein